MHSIDVIQITLTWKRYVLKIEKLHVSSWIIFDVILNAFSIKRLKQEWESIYFIYLISTCFDCISTIDFDIASRNIFETGFINDF